MPPARESYPASQLTLLSPHLLTILANSIMGMRQAIACLTLTMPNSQGSGWPIAITGRDQQEGWRLMYRLTRIKMVSSLFLLTSHNGPCSKAGNIMLRFYGMRAICRAGQLGAHGVRHQLRISLLPSKQSSFFIRMNGNGIGKGKVI